MHLFVAIKARILYHDAIEVQIAEKPSCGLRTETEPQALHTGTRSATNLGERDPSTQNL
jgi:hypothetical protein